MLQLGKASVFQWSQRPPAASVTAREAGPAVAHGFFLPPSLAPFPTSPVYMDTPRRNMLALPIF